MHWHIAYMSIPSEANTTKYKMKVNISSKYLASMQLFNKTKAGNRNGRTFITCVSKTIKYAKVPSVQLQASWLPGWDVFHALTALWSRGLQGWEQVGAGGEITCSLEC